MNELDKKLIQKMDKNLDRKKKIAVKIENKEERSKQQLWELAQSNSSLIKEPEEKVEKGNGFREWLNNHVKSFDSLVKVAEDLDENGICVPDNVVEDALFNEDENQTLYPIKDLTVGEFSEILTKKIWNTLKEKGYIGDDNTLYALVDDDENDDYFDEFDEEQTETYDDSIPSPNSSSQVSPSGNCVSLSEEKKEDGKCFKERKLEDSPLFDFNDIKLYITMDNHFLHGEIHDIRIWKMGNDNKMNVSFRYVPDYYETNFIAWLSEPYNVMVSFNNKKPRLNDLGQFSLECFHTTKEDDKVFYNITLGKELN